MPTRLKDTRYLMFQNNSKFSLLSPFAFAFFINNACFVESECKDTTIFQTTKKNLKKNFLFAFKPLFLSNKKECFFSHNPKKSLAKFSFSHQKKPIFKFSCPILVNNTVFNYLSVNYKLPTSLKPIANNLIFNKGKDKPIKHNGY